MMAAPKPTLDTLLIRDRRDHELKEHFSGEFSVRALNLADQA